MRGTRFAPFVALLAAVALLGALAACGKDEPTRGPNPGGSPPGDVDGAGGTDRPDPGGMAVAEAAALDTAWWRRTPRARVLLTGGRHGVLRPNPATEPHQGGLPRTAAVLYRLREAAGKAGTAVGALSLGWSMDPRAEPQSEAAADYVRATHEQLRFDAALLGGSDLLVPGMCQPRGPGVETPTPPVNVKLADVNPAAGATRVYAAFDVGPVPVRAFSVVDPAEAQPLADAGFVDAASSPAQTMAGLQARPESLWVVGTRVVGASTLAEVRSSLARLGPGVVVDVGGGGHGVDRVDDHRLAPGAAPLVLELPPHGTAVGVLDIDPMPGGGWIVAYRQIPLVPAWEKYGGAPLRAVQQLAALHGELLRERGYLRSWTRVADGAARYVGSSACAACHAAIYADWKRSAHAGALETLVDAGSAWDPACVRCHVVGWERSGEDGWFVRASGFRDPERTPFLGGVGCESCHGPGSAHVAAPHDPTLFGPQGPGRRRPEVATCEACHDEANDPGFADAYARDALPFVDHRRVPADRKTVVPPERREAGGGK